MDTPLKSWLLGDSNRVEIKSRKGTLEFKKNGPVDMLQSAAFCVNGQDRQKAATLLYLSSKTCGIRPSKMLVKFDSQKAKGTITTLINPKQALEGSIEIDADAFDDYVTLSKALPAGL